MFISNVSEDWSFFMTAFGSIWASGCKFTSNRSFSGNIRNLLLSPDFRLTILHLFSNGMYMFFLPPLHPFFEFRFTKKIFSVFFTHSTIITVSIIYFVYYVKILTHLLYYFIIFQQLYVLFFYKKTNKLHKNRCFLLYFYTF